MQKQTNPSFIPKFYCNLFGHHYYVSKKVTYHVKEYTCKHCKKQMTTNSNGNLIALTPKFKEINALLERVYKKKKNRLNKNLVSSSIFYFFHSLIQTFLVY